MGRKLADRFRLINANKDVDHTCEHLCDAKKIRDKKVRFKLLRSKTLPVAIIYVTAKGTKTI